MGCDWICVFNIGASAAEGKVRGGEKTALVKAMGASGVCEMFCERK